MPRVYGKDIDQFRYWRTHYALRHGTRYRRRFFTSESPRVVITMQERRDWILRALCRGRGKPRLCVMGLMLFPKCGWDSYLFTIGKSMKWPSPLGKGRSLCVEATSSERRSIDEFSFVEAAIESTYGSIPGVAARLLLFSDVIGVPSGPKDCTTPSNDFPSLRRASISVAS